MSTKIDPKELRAGTVVKHSSGGTVTLSHRKTDGSGWWNTDGSGLADRAWESGDWTVDIYVKDWATQANEAADHAEKLATEIRERD